MAMGSLIALGPASAFSNGNLRSLREETSKFFENSAKHSRTRLRYQNDFLVTNSEQAAVDDYLEFLDKRYHRLHDDNPEKVKFRIWEWLLKKNDAKENEDKDIAVPKAQTENALFALGVAGLASERLLQKHTILEAAKTSKTIDVETAVAPPSAVGLSIVSAMDGTLAPSLRHLAVQRRMLISYGPMTLLRSVLVPLISLVRIVAKAPMKLGQMLLDLGGGSKTMKFSATLMVVLLCSLRPLALTVLSEAFALQQA